MRNYIRDVKETTSGTPTADEGTGIAFTLAGIMKNNTVVFDAPVTPAGHVYLTDSPASAQSSMSENDGDSDT